MNKLDEAAELAKIGMHRLAVAATILKAQKALKDLLPSAMEGVTELEMRLNVHRSCGHKTTRVVRSYEQSINRANRALAAARALLKEIP